MKDVESHIGLDDIDSPSGGCTTHFASLVTEFLHKLNVHWLDYPGLIRLNPAVPYRTRGNGAVVLRFRTELDILEELTARIEDMTRRYVDQSYPNTNPGFVLVTDSIPSEVRAVAEQALWRALPRDLAKRVVEKHALYHFSRGNSRGLVGALAAIGNTLEGDHTYEYIAYRSLDDCNGDRRVDHHSVRVMDNQMGDSVFNNIDTETGRVIVDPHGPDPVLYGIRGESAASVLKAGKKVRSGQPVDRWMIFRTNQGTGAHLEHVVHVMELRPYMTAMVEGVVRKTPRTIEGGHVILRISDTTGEIDAAAYEPTGGFRETVRQLRIGDECRFYGSVRPRSRTHGRTLNLEGMEVLRVVPVIKHRNPLCPDCGKRLKSAGRGKGHKCAKCGFRSTELEKKAVPVERGLKKGVFLPPQRAQRHLTRPLERLNKCNKGVPSALIDKWHAR